MGEAVTPQQNMDTAAALLTTMATLNAMFPADFIQGGGGFGSGYTPL